MRLVSTMMENWWMTLAIILALSISAILAYPIISAKSPARPVIKQYMFLGQDFFESLLLLTSFWTYLLILVMAQELKTSERQMVTGVVCVAATFLIWWWNKRF